MIHFIFENKLTIINLLNLVVWFYYYRKSRLNGLNKDIVKYFIFYFALLLTWDIMMIMGDRSGKIYLFFWAVFNIYELYFFATVLFKLTGWDYKWLAVIIPSIPVISGSILSYHSASYQPVNRVDFFNSLLLLLCSSLILWIFFVKKDFLKNLEAFFIFCGFILFFILHILASNILFFDFLKHWNFASLSTLIVHYFWIGSILCTQRIRSKYSS